MVFFRDVFGGFTVVDQRIQFRHTLIRKTPSQRAVIHGDIATLKRIRRFAHYPRAAGHTFDTSGNEQIAMIGFDRPSRLIDRLEARSTETIHSSARDSV